MNPSLQGAAQDLHARLFKAVLLESDLAQREDRGELLRSANTAVAPLLGSFAEYFSRDLRDRAERMTYVYSLFYCFENAVRELVAQRLEERKGPTWWEFVPQGVQGRVEKKKQDAQDNKWHQATIDSNIDYTLFGDLADIIQKEWPEFADLFPTQMWVKQRLDELERSRNIISHGNLLSEPEIERIEQYLGDWLRQVP